MLPCGAREGEVTGLVEEGVVGEGDQEAEEEENPKTKWPSLLLILYKYIWPILNPL